LYEGKPVVTPSGVELWHPKCLALRDEPVITPVVVAIAAQAAPRRWPLLAGAGTVAVALAVLLVPRTSPSANRVRALDEAAAVIAVDSPNEPLVMKARATVREQTPSYAVPTVEGQALDEGYPSLLDWTHPVTGTTEKVPEQGSRLFGAERKGIERSECGAGHCGIDLDGPRGRPVVAVADGVVVRVERHELGLDGRSGRYVRIEHDDGALTAYMHLDDVADGLEVGDHVDGGQYIGTLGATAVYSAAPHLHFSLEVPNVYGTHGDNTNTHYVDPAPFLARAAIAPVPDRRRATKPSL
jgi:murein DD-endopeptidase MepM/ murein hydrolase activator NlpD